MNVDGISSHRLDKNKIRQYIKTGTKSATQPPKYLLSSSSLVSFTSLHWLEALIQLLQALLSSSFSLPFLNIVRLDDAR